MSRQPLFVAMVIFMALCGMFWAAHIGWYGLSIEHKLDGVNVATLAVNVFIAYFLQYYFISRAADNRSEKDILIDGLRDVLASVRQCRDTVLACQDAGKITPTSAKSIKLLFRKIANGMENVETAIEMSRCSGLKDECKEIQHALFSYKSAATGGNFPSKPYDAQAFSYQERTYRALSEKLHDLVFKVNQHQ